MKIFLFFSHEFFIRTDLIAFYDNSDPNGLNFHRHWGNKKIIITGTCQGITKTFQAVIADTCANQDCNNCCANNSHPITGYLIDIEYYTLIRHFNTSNCPEIRNQLSFTIDFTQLPAISNCGPTLGPCYGEGECCSSDGYCSYQGNACGKGCQNDYGYCYPLESCGPSYGNQQCGDNKCCSQFGFCGTLKDHCSIGCQVGYGHCWNESSIPTISPTNQPTVVPSIYSPTSTQSPSLLITQSPSLFPTISPSVDEKFQWGKITFNAKFHLQFPVSNNNNSRITELSQPAIHAFYETINAVEENEPDKLQYLVSSLGRLRTRLLFSADEISNQFTATFQLSYFIVSEVDGTQIYTIASGRLSESVLDHSFENQLHDYASFLNATELLDVFVLSVEFQSFSLSKADTNSHSSNKSNILFLPIQFFILFLIAITLGLIFVGYFTAHWVMKYRNSESIRKSMIIHQKIMNEPESFNGIYSYDEFNIQGNELLHTTKFMKEQFIDRHGSEDPLKG